MKKIIFLVLSLNFLYANKYYYEFNKKVEVEEIEKNSSVDDTKEYTTKDGKIVRFKNEILVQCKENADCQDEFEELSLDNIEQIDSRFFLIKLDDTKDIFEYCEKLYQKSDIESAHPNFINKRTKR